MINITALFITGLVAAIPAASPAADEFKLVKDNGTIALYERWIEKNDEKIREVKAIFSVKSDINAITDLFKDEKRGLQWNVRAEQYKIVPAGDASKWITYIKYNVPWPMDDQDCCLFYQVKPAVGNTTEIVFQSANNSQFPVNKNISRITGTRGRWVLEKQDHGQLKVTYYISTDRKKNIPRWISDPIVHENLLKTMSRFKDLLEKN